MLEWVWNVANAGELRSHSVRLVLHVGDDQGAQGFKFPSTLEPNILSICLHIVMSECVIEIIGTQRDFLRFSLLEDGLWPHIRFSRLLENLNEAGKSTNC